MKSGNQRQPTKALIILTLNEIEGSQALYSQLPLHLFDRVLLVDGGSTDGTRQFWIDRGVEVFPRNSPGRGSAFLFAMESCQEDILLFFSPDGNEDPRSIPAILKALDKADLVIATRFGRGGTSEDAGIFRAFGNHLFTCICNILFRCKVTDAVNGFRGIWHNRMTRLNLVHSKFEIEMQMTIRAAKTGLKIVEVPTHEGPRIGGISKVNSFAVGASFLVLILKELISGKRFLNRRASPIQALIKPGWG